MNDGSNEDPRSAGADPRLEGRDPRSAGADPRIPDPNCLFCKIVAGEIPARVAYEDEIVVAFHDIAPRAPTHVLLVPRQHIASALDLTDADGPLLGRLFTVAARLAREQGIAESGFRLVSNVGRWGGQTVDHLHLHLLGGRAFAWPPG